MKQFLTLSWKGKFGWILTYIGVIGLILIVIILSPLWVPLWLVDRACKFGKNCIDQAEKEIRDARK